jgi:hypothetical protein
MLPPLATFLNTTPIKSLSWRRQELRPMSTFRGFTRMPSKLNF